MRHNIRKSNQQLMYGVMVMAIVVLMIAGMFLYWCTPVK